MKRLLLCIFILTILSLPACKGSDDSGLTAAKVPGVTDTSIRLGSSLALKGHAGYLGTQFLRGAMSYLHHVNHRGGVYGRHIEVKAIDDSYDPPKCLVNTQRFIIEEDVFALFCYVGTPTTAKVLPLVEEARIPLLGMFTGANSLREPFNRYIINIRASYYQETASAIEHVVKDLGIKDVAVFYQFDAYGFDGLVGTELALKKLNLEPVARGSYVRGTVDVREGVDKIAASKAGAVFMIGTYDACAEFIMQARKRDYNPVFYTVSFVGAEELARLLGRAPQSTVLMSQVMPPFAKNSKNDAALDYIRLLKDYYPKDKPSYVGLEGFINARILVEGLRRAGADLTRERFIDAIQSIRDYHVAKTASISFGPGDHQGMDSVFFTRLEGSRFEPFTNWKGLRKELNSKAGK